MAEATSARERPLSPHLDIYRRSINMMMSIVHRITGAALYFGTLLLAWWLIALATGPSHFGFVNALAASWFGKLVLLGYTWALLHHMLGGLRHLIWDTGKGFSLSAVRALSWASLIGSLALTALVWAAGLKMAGAY